MPALNPFSPGVPKEDGLDGAELLLLLEEPNTNLSREIGAKPQVAPLGPAEVLPRGLAEGDDNSGLRQLDLLIEESRGTMSRKTGHGCRGSGGRSPRDPR